MGVEFSRCLHFEGLKSGRPKWIAVEYICFLFNTKGVFGEKQGYFEKNKK
jgi:hypothetical protein